MQKNIRAVVFDFDNVLVLTSDGTGSEEVKDAVWPKVFGEDWERLHGVFPEIVNRWSGGKGSRFEMVRDALTHLQFHGDREAEVQKRCELFNELVQEGILAIGIAPEARAFLEMFSRRLPLFINSATPTAAMNETLEKLGIKNLFRAVYSQEHGKAASLRRVMREADERNPKKVVFVGDSLTDYEAAQEVGCRFVGVATKRNGWGRNKRPFLVVSGVSELEKFL